MTLTKDVLVKLIKEELEAIMAEQGEELEEVDPVDAEIAQLEKRLAEAKHKKMQKGKMSGKRAAGGMKMKGTTANVYDKNFGKKGVKKSSK